MVSTDTNQKNLKKTTFEPKAYTVLQEYSQTVIINYFPPIVHVFSSVVVFELGIVCSQSIDNFWTLVYYCCLYI